MLDTHITLLETHHFSHATFKYDSTCFVCVLERKPLTLNIVEKVATRFNICFTVCWIKCDIFPAKKFEQTSSNMHATRSNIVDPTKLFYNIMFERVAGA